MPRKPNPKLRTLLLTGGHLTPAIALIEELKKQGGWRMIYLGRQSSREGSRIVSWEAQEIPKLGVKFISLPAGKVPRHFNRFFIFSLTKIPLGFFLALWHLWREKPQVVVSFGGYLAVPVVLAAVCFRIPVVTHEQTVVKGLANGLIEKFAAKIAVSWPVTVQDFRSGAVVTGNPVRQVIIRGPGEPVGQAGAADLPLIYLTGGNQGSHQINLTVLEMLPRLTQQYRLVHQCGIGLEGDDYRRLSEAKSMLPARQQSKYLVSRWFTEAQTAWLLRNAALVISRSGANIVTELALIGVKAILIPLPRAGRNEQYRNAQLLKQSGVAEVLPQSQLNPQNLLSLIEAMQKNHSFYQLNFPKARQLVKPDAARRLAELVKELYAETYQPEK